MPYSDYHKKVVVSPIQYEDVGDGQFFGDEDTLYLFGDNVIRSGKGGQAKIRQSVNSFGIVTKRLPNNTDKAYLSDEYLDLLKPIILSDIRYVLEAIQLENYDKIHIPAGGLGTGLADMKNRCPKTFAFLSKQLYKHFGFVNPGWEGGKHVQE